MKTYQEWLNENDGDELNKIDLAIEDWRRLSSSDKKLLDIIKKDKKAIQHYQNSTYEKLVDFYKNKNKIINAVRGDNRLAVYMRTLIDNFDNIYEIPEKLKILDPGVFSSYTEGNELSNNFKSRLKFYVNIPINMILWHHSVNKKYSKFSDEKEIICFDTNLYIKNFNVDHDDRGRKFINYVQCDMIKK